MNLIRRYWFTAAFILLLALCFVAALIGAQDRAIPSPERIAAITITPTIDLNGTVVAFVFEAHRQIIDAKPSGEITATPIGSVQVDLAKSQGSVVVGDTQYEYREAMGIIQAIADREWRLAHPEPLPQRRRAIRTQP